MPPTAFVPPAFALGAAVPRRPTQPPPSSWSSGADVARGAVRRRIVDPAALHTWKRSKAYADVMSFISELCGAVQGRRLTDDVPTSPFVRATCELLDEAAGWVDDIPPTKQAMRYGNTAFRGWHAKMCERTPEMMRSLLGRFPPPTPTAPLPTCFIESAISSRAEYEASTRRPEAERRALEAAALAKRAAHGGAAQGGDADSRSDELAGYFAESFGNATRIDYGTGHELAFLVWLRCVVREGANATWSLSEYGRAVRRRAAA